MWQVCPDSQSLVKNSLCPWRVACVYEHTCGEDNFKPLFSSIYFDREVERKEEPQSQRGVARESHSASHFNISMDKKRSPCVHITAASSFPSGKSIGPCGVACVIINNNFYLHRHWEIFAVE